MAKIVLDMSMSLDGFIAGPDDGIEHPMGVAGHISTKLDPVRSLEAPGVMHLHYRVRAPQHRERQM